MRLRFIQIVVAVVALSVPFAQDVSARTWRVEKDGTGDFTVIQAALDATADGDTVLIGPGEFLEETVFRPAGWGYDIRAFGRVLCDSLTIVGAGVGFTVIGPAIYTPDHQQFNPKGFYYSDWGSLTIENLTVRNCRSAVKGGGRVFVQDCEFLDNYYGMSWETVGSGGWIKSTFVRGINDGWPGAMDLIGPSNNFVVEDCQFAQCGIVVRGITDFRLVRCNVSNYGVGMTIYGDSQVLVDKCIFANISRVGIGFTLDGGGSCEVRGSTVSGGRVALQPGPGSQFIVDSSTLIGGEWAVVRAVSNPAPMTINNCDFVKGTGPIILCENISTPVTHDLTNNYWGTTDAAEIEQWIVDINDDPGVLATVLFDPFAMDSVPVKGNKKSFGNLKAMFR